MPFRHWKALITSIDLQKQSLDFGRKSKTFYESYGDPNYSINPLVVVESLAWFLQFVCCRLGAGFEGRRATRLSLLLAWNLKPHKWIHAEFLLAETCLCYGSSRCELDLQKKRQEKVVVHVVVRLTRYSNLSRSSRSEIVCSCTHQEMELFFCIFGKKKVKPQKIDWKFCLWNRSITLSMTVDCALQVSVVHL